MAGRQRQPWQRLYGTARWQRLRHAQLSAEPLCCMCLMMDVVEAASVVDHVRSHKGDESVFFDSSNLQSLCKPHHDGAKQRMDKGGRAFEVGLDGYLIEIG